MWSICLRYYSLFGGIVMKINTREKLQILIFGLNAGNNLNMFWHSRIKKCAIFSDGIDEVQFYLAEDGSITCEDEGDDYDNYYKILGCMEHSKAEANELFPKIK